MNMQDNEFDKLFSSRLEDFSVEPSKQVWQNINAELGGSNYKKLVPYLSIAASIIVLIATGVIFIPRHVKVNIKQPVKEQVAVNKQAKLVPATNVKSSIVEGPKVTQPTNTQVATVRSTKKTAPFAIQPAPVLVKQNMVKNETQPILAAVPEMMIQHDTTKPEPVLASVETVKTPQKQDVIAAVPPVNDKASQAQPIKKRGVHSFGDMLNVVIAAVDKRKDKFIEFTNTDGDEATITGVNLGVIKIKKEN